MAEEKTTTETVTTKSSGNVKISLEEYNDLTRRANEQKVTYNQTIVEKTPEMAATDKVVMGNIFMVAGMVQVGLGIYLRIKGRNELKGL